MNLFIVILVVLHLGLPVVTGAVSVYIRGGQRVENVENLKTALFQSVQKDIDLW